MSATKIDTRFFNQACRSIAKAVAKPPEEVVTSELGKVLEQAIKFTRSAKAGLIRKGHDYYALGQDTYSPKKVRRYGNLTKNGYLYYNMRTNRYPTELWAILREARRQSIAKLLAARGLAKQSFVDLAIKLGVKVEAPAYVKAAIARTGKKYPENTSVKKVKGKGKILITITNSQPTAVNTNAAFAIQRAIEGRAKFFIKNVQLGVFDDMKKAAKQYPGMKIAA